MEIKLLSQYAGESDLSTEINILLSQNKYSLFRILVAYISLGGIKILEEEIYKLLEKKGSFVDWIIGFEDIITSKETLEYLLHLKNKFPEKVRVRIFTAGNNTDKFHPKIYWLGNSDEYSVIIGSSNFTNGGLLNNFEASTFLNLKMSEDADKKLIYDLENIWRKFSTPIPPLNEDNLIELNKEVIESINSTVVAEKKKIDAEIRKFAHPFQKANKHKEIQANIRKFHSDLLKKRQSFKKDPRLEQKQEKEHPKSLVMDILQETRETQVQLPTDVLKPFFDIVDSHGKNEILLSEVIDGNLVNMKIRPFISQKNMTHRLEIAGIKGLLRPLIIKFTRRDEQEYDYEIFTKSSPDYDKYNDLLNTKGKQARQNSRRWYLE